MSHRHEEDEEDYSPFKGIKKNQVLQEIKQFNLTPIAPRACCNTLTRIMYLVQQGEAFSKEENTNIFFSATKLFQNQDPALRRLVHLVIKVLDIESHEVMMVTSSLVQDINNSKVDSFRSNAIRVLAKIIDAPMLNQVERFFKQAIVDKNEFTASSALVAGIQLFPLGVDTVKRWANEIQEAVNNKTRMVQYHALHLLYLIKRHDRLAISKIITTLIRSPPKAPLTMCLLIRYVGTALSEMFESTGGIHDKLLLDFLTTCLRNKSSMVVYEAAREFSRLKGATGMQLVPVVVALQDFLNHPLSSQRFAAVRTLALIVERFPHLITSMAVDLERLISDSNRSTATLAITTLLKTGVEASIDRLLKTISGFMAEISDEFKIVVVEAIRSLGLKFPQKYSPLLKFLSSMLREDGGFLYKKIVISTILSLMQAVEDAKEIGLDILCEFIEDCEFSELSVQVLHVLAEEAGKIKNPARFIRHIFNRVILETEAVRAGAVSALAKIGASVDEITASTVVLLNRCLYDMDDETRDRATLYINFLKEEHGFSKKNLLALSSLPSSISVPSLEYSVQQYLDKGDFSHPFSLDLVMELKADAAPVSAAADLNVVSNVGLGSVVVEAAHIPQIESNSYAELLKSVRELQALALGPLLRSSKPVDLTEVESEYLVKCIKHVYTNHFVLQFNIINTLPNQTIDKVHVELDLSSSDWTVKKIVPSIALATGASGVTYICLQRPSGTYTFLGNAVLKYDMKDADDLESAGFPDEYVLDDVEITSADLVIGSNCDSIANFRKRWEELGNQSESIKKFNLAIPSLQEAINAVIDLIGLFPVENSNLVADGATSHAVTLSGVFIGNIPVLARAGFMVDAKNGVALKIAARSESLEIADLITNSIQ